MKNALVGGGTGFIGSAIVSRLVKTGFRVFIPTRDTKGTKSSKFFWGEDYNSITLLDASTDWSKDVRDVEFEMIFHLASFSDPIVSNQDLETCVDANITQGLKLAFVASQQKKKPPFVYAQSFWQFATGSKNPVPNSVYASLKQGFQLLAEHYRINKNIPAVGLVIFETFSASDRRDKLLPRLARVIADQKKGRAITPLKLTSGTQQICFTHVDDVADAFVLAAQYAFETDPKLLQPLLFLSQEKNKPLRRVIDEMLFDYDNAENLILWGGKSHRPEDVFVLVDGPTVPGWKASRDLKECFQSMVKQLEDE